MGVLLTFFWCLRVSLSMAAKKSQGLGDNLAVNSLCYKNVRVFSSFGLSAATSTNSTKWPDLSGLGWVEGFAANNGLCFTLAR